MSHPTPAWLDVQYNNRARVPQAARILERWALASALARERSTCHLDMPYGRGIGETLDVFPSLAANGTAGGAPVLVFIHGGWWRSLDKRDHSFVAPAFTQSGAMVVVPNYALCPGVTIEAIALQMVRALVWVHAHAAAYGGDPKRVVVAGHSAGGHLAAMLLCCRWDSVAPGLPRHLVDRALAISGLFDLEPLRRTPYLQRDLQLTRRAVRRLSPVGFAPPQGRLYAAVGADESEEFLRQSRAIRNAWGERAVPVCETIAGAHHFDVLHALVDPEARLHRLALELLGLARDRDENRYHL